MSLTTLVMAWGLFLVADPVLREWKDTTGAFSVEASLVSVKDGVVALRRKDGEEVRVRLDKLSRADREFLQSRGERAKDKRSDQIISWSECDTLRKKPLGAELKGKTWDDLESLVTQRTGVPTIVHRKSLERMGISSKQPLGITGDTLSLSELLHQLGTLHKVTWTFSDGVLRIMPERDPSLQTMVYEVLTKTPRRGSPRPQRDMVDMAPLVKSIQGVADSWEHLGGKGSLKRVDSCLWIAHDGAMHQRIQEKFAGRIRPLEMPAPWDTLPPVKELKKVKEGLKKPVALEHAGTPLDNVVRKFSEEIGVPMQLDTPSIESTGVTPKAPTTVHLREVAASVALDELVQFHGLSYYCDEGKIILAGPREAAQHLISIEYPATRIDGPRGKVADGLQVVVDPPSWTHSGGKGALEAAANGAVIVRQTLPNHLKIAPLVDAMARRRNAK